MNRYLLLLLFALYGSACTSDAPQPQTKAPAAPRPAAVPSKEVYLSEINALLRIPEDYQPITIEAFYDLDAAQASGNPEYLAHVQEAIARANRPNFSTDVFVDPTERDNSIWVYSGRFLPYLPINRETAPQAVALVKQQARASGAAIAFTEQKLGGTKTFRYIKIKGTEKYAGTTYYLTYYFLSSKRTSFIVKVQNTEDVDYLGLVEQMVFRGE